MENYKYIISQFECVNNVLKETYIGYTDSEQDAATINDIYQNTFGAWIEANRPMLEDGLKEINEFFLPNEKIYSANLKATCIDDLNLSLITDINNLGQWL